MENPFEIILEKLNSIEFQLKEIKEQQNQKFKDELMDIAELCKYISYQKTSIYGLVQKRKISFIKAGGKLHFHKNDIDQWLNNGKRKTRNEIDNKARGYQKEWDGEKVPF